MQEFGHLKYAAATDVGRKRANNEDKFGVFPDHGIFCVSDGMGGGDDGEVASDATINAIEDFCKAHPLPENATYQIDGLVAGLRHAVNAASAWIYRRAQQNRLKGCGATFVGACFDAANPEEAVALHAGDSRLYRIRGRSIQQITKDHSAAELIGAKNEKDVNPMFRGMILRAVGIQPSVEVEQTPLPVKPGDRILICSDGLSRMVPDKKLLSICRANEDVDKAVEELIAAANEAGGIDNVTVVLVDVGPLPPPVAPMPLALVSQREPVTGTTSRDADSNSVSETDSGVGFATCDTFGASENDSATATNTLASFSGDDTATGTLGAVTTTGTAGQEAMTVVVKGDDVRVRMWRAKLKRMRFVQIALGVVIALFLAGLVGNVVFHRRKVAAERRHAAEIAEVERIAREKAAEEKRKQAEAEKKRLEEVRKRAEAEKKRLEKVEAEKELLKKKIAEVLEEKKRKEEAERLALEKAQAEAQETRRKAEEAEAARRKAEEDAEAALKAKRKAEEDAAAAREAKKKAEAEAAAEIKKKEAARAEEERLRIARQKEMLAALKELTAACELETAAAYAEKIHKLNCDTALDELPVQFNEMRDASTTPERRKVLAEEITKNVKMSVKQLVTYARTELDGLDSEMVGADSGRQAFLKAQMKQRRAFLGEARQFKEMRSDSAEAYRRCARMIRGIPGWFR